MAKLFSLLAACLLALSSTASANNLNPHFTVTVIFQNNSSHTIAGFGSSIPGGAKGQCDFMSDRLVCTPDNQGKIHQIGHFFLNDGQAAPLTISNAFPEYDAYIDLGSLYPTPVKVVLTNNQWDGKSDLTTTLTITDNPDQVQ